MSGDVLPFCIWTAISQDVCELVLTVGPHDGMRHTSWINPSRQMTGDGSEAVRAIIQSCDWQVQYLKPTQNQLLLLWKVHTGFPERDSAVFKPVKHSSAFGIVWDQPHKWIKSPSNTSQRTFTWSPCLLTFDYCLSLVFSIVYDSTF